MLILINTFSSAMSASVKNREENFPGPMSRTRSSSANEASKPISMLQRRQTHAGSKPLNFSPSGGKCKIFHSNLYKFILTFFLILIFFLLISNALLFYRKYI